MHPTKRHLLPLLPVVVVGLTWMQPPGPLAQSHGEAGLKRSSATFAAARGLNAVISEIPGTEVNSVVFGTRVLLMLMAAWWLWRGSLDRWSKRLPM